MKTRYSRLLHGSIAGLLAALAAASAVAADTGQSRTSGKDAAATITLTSSAFQNNGAMPSKYTCEGQDSSPPLSWKGVPSNAKSLVLIVDDPDAPDPAAPKKTVTHWLLYNIPPSATGLPEGVSASDLPSGTLQGTNEWRRTGYGGPCPPIGEHRYFFKIYALDSTLSDMKRPKKAKLEKAIKGHVLASGELIGLYRKQK